MTLDGKSRSKKNVKLLFNDVISSFPNRFVSNFSSMMGEIVYPRFTKKFSKKLDFLQKKNPEAAEIVFRINTEHECENYGIDCMVARNRFSDTIEKLYRIYSN